MKKALALLVIISQFIIGCGGTHTITRVGYEPPVSEKSTCDIILSKTYIANPKSKKLGEIKLGDSGNSVKCGSAEAYGILKTEGCKLEANLVIITNETLPNDYSNCYQCEATFYLVDSSFLIKSYNSNNTLSNEQIAQNRTNSGGSNIGIKILAYGVGFAIGYYLGSLIFKK